MNRLPPLRATTLGVALALSSAVSQAQPAQNEMPMPTAEAAPAHTAAIIKVRNAPSAIIAYWLDPLHQPVPTLVEHSRRNGELWTRDADELPRQPGNGNGPRDLKLPQGIESVFSVDPQNVLQVKGTEAGIEALRKLVQEIDVPIGQLEIEAQIWEISPAKLKSLPLVFRDTAVATRKFRSLAMSESAMRPIMARATFSREPRSLRQHPTLAPSYKN